MVGGVEAIVSLSRLSEGVPNAPFAGYSGADVRLERGGERGVKDGVTEEQLLENLGPTPSELAPSGSTPSEITSSGSTPSEFAPSEVLAEVLLLAARKPENWFLLE